MPHELPRAFDAVGLPLCQTLTQMLDDHPKHCTLRRGCGLTQSTRFLATSINRPRDPADVSDLEMFGVLSPRHAGAVAAHALAAGWPGGWRDLCQAPEAVRGALDGLPDVGILLTLGARLEQVAAAVRLPESHLLLALIGEVLGRGGHSAAPLPLMAEKPAIGSCSQAEEFFLEIAHGKIRRGGRVNIWVDAEGRAVLVEKMALGESHSAVFVRAATLCGVRIPPGSLAALRPAAAATAQSEHAHGLIHALTELAAVRFLRLTTLALAPADRERAFSTQFRRQVSGNMLSPATTTLDDLRDFADAIVKRA